jgi:uridine kinase
LSTPAPAPSGNSSTAAPLAAVTELLAAIDRWRAASQPVLVVAVDGHGASGKTTIARQAAAATGAALIHTDDFFHDPREDGERPGSAEYPQGGDAPLPLSAYYDWAALRTQALEPLRAGRAATFPRRHWEESHAAGEPVVVEPRALVLLEGVSAATEDLADLVDRRVLVDTPEPVRLRRLHGRIAEEDWDAVWLAAERRYFDSRPPDFFDLTVSGADPKVGTKTP